jgi:hypothetical protein
MRHIAGPLLELMAELSQRVTPPPTNTDSHLDDLIAHKRYMRLKDRRDELQREIDVIDDERGKIVAGHSAPPRGDWIFAEGRDE